MIQCHLKFFVFYSNFVKNPVGLKLLEDILHLFYIHKILVDIIPEDSDPEVWFRECQVLLSNLIPCMYIVQYFLPKPGRVRSKCLAVGTLYYIPVKHIISKQKKK